MKKFINFCIIAIVAMLGFTSCNDCDHDFIEHDHSADLVGTWTCFKEGFAEALVISADGSVVSTGVADGKYWENVKGKISVKDGKANLAFEDDIKFEGHFDIIPGMAFSILEDNGNRFTLNYCKEDLADEIVGMWVSTDNSSTEENNVLIQTFYENGKSTYTGFGAIDGELVLNKESNYKVIGDLSFQEINGKYIAWKVSYFKDGTAFGDIMTNANGDFTSSWLRVKQSLNLTNKSYDYSDVYVTNVKGLDKDIPFHPEYTFNFAKMDGTLIDQILKSILFGIEFPDANTFKYSCSYPNPNTSMEAPMVVDGNKVTVKMSERNAAYRDIDFYMFQDAYDSQLHMYLPTYSFINFYGNMQIIMMEQLGQIDTTDAAAVKAVYDSLDEAVETINMSFVMEASK